jgi:hypothetical protein
MQALRNAPRLARLVLAWFALTLLTAAASPVMQADGGQWVCSGGAMKLVLKGEPGEAAGTQTLDCPLCIAQDAAPPIATAALPRVHPLGHAVQPIPAARIAALTAAPLPARGPPASLSIQ